MTLILCTHCGFSRNWRLRRDKRKCKRCRREFSARVYPVSGFRLTQDEWRDVIRAFLAWKTVRKMAKHLCMGPRQVQKVSRVLRLAMGSESLPTFSGPIEVDETYIGGQRKNQRLHIRKRYPPKRGHGTRKLPIFGIFDRSSGKVFAEVLPKKLDAAHILKRIQEHTEPHTCIYTDGFPTYRIFAPAGYLHESIDHNRGEYVRGDIHTNNIEGFWGILKRTMGCIGGMQRKYLHLFLAEIVWRFNHRTETEAEKERALFALVLSFKFGGRKGY